MISSIILSLLTKEKAFARKVLPHIKEDYFETIEKKKIFGIIKNYVVQYRNLPTESVLKLELTKDETLSENLFESLSSEIDSIMSNKDEHDPSWVIDQTEEWCKERALHNAIIDSVQLIEDKKPRGSIPEIIRKALQVEFDTNIGINFLEKSGVDDRWERYQRKDIKLSTNIEPLDNAFGGGVELKALTMLMGGCVTKDSLITIKNKKTNKIQSITVGEFYGIFE